MNKLILVLDKEAYKCNEETYKDILQKSYDTVEIIYTEYEDKLIRTVRNWKYIGVVLQHLLYWKKSFDYAKEILRKSANTILCINPIVGIFLGIMNRNIDIILCGFLFEPKKNKVYYALRKRFTEQCLKGVRYAVVYSEQEVEYYEHIFPGIHKFVYVPYGIDYLIENQYEGWLPERYIFSGGGSNRDYKTLVEGYNLLCLEKKVPDLVIATLPRCLAGLNIDNVHLLTDVVIETFGSVIRRSDCVVLSLKDSELSVGHQVILEALKNNAIIIVNKIKAVENYVGEGQVIFYESGNILDLKEKIEYVFANYEMLKQSAHQNNNFYEERYTFGKLLERLIKL